MLQMHQLTRLSQRQAIGWPTCQGSENSIRDAEMRYVEGTLPHAEAVAIFDAASAAVPHAASLVTLLSNIDGVPAMMQMSLPELINDTNIARITDVLRFIDNELNGYFADSDGSEFSPSLAMAGK